MEPEDFCSIPVRCAPYLWSKTGSILGSRLGPAERMLAVVGITGGLSNFSLLMPAAVHLYYGTDDNWRDVRHVDSGEHQV